MGIFTRRAARTKPALTEVPAVESSVPKDFSESARQVWVAFQALPTEHQPSYDLESMLRALDLKYGSLADEHLDTSYFYDSDALFGDYRLDYVDLDSCTCRRSYEDDAYGDETGECLVPEYLELLEGIEEVQDALADREAALRVLSRRAELEGVEYELKNVRALTDALRSERDLVRDVTSELASVK